MMHRIRAAWLLILLLPFLSSHAATERSDLKHGPLPPWFDLQQVDAVREHGAGSPRVAPTSTGLEFLRYDRQIELASETATIHCVYRITSDAGLAEGSRLSFDFDPSYENLTYHFVRTWRNGTPRDRFDFAQIKVLQQERDLHRQIYNGSLSTLQLLSDVRVGDVVEYALSLHGRNPVFHGKFIDVQHVGWSSPVREQRLRVLVPSGRELKVHSDGANHFTHTSRDLADGQRELSWIGRDLTPITPDYDAPSWHQQIPLIELSEFHSWRDVARWALPLYPLPGDAPPSLAETVRSLVHPRTQPEEQVLMILDFVQREIRYLALALGSNSHQPHPPAEVLERRFGDCKDKTALFCALLHELGVDAQPVLVNTYRRHRTGEGVPSPYAFNHVIARVRLNGREYWLDPTQTYQRGPLAARDISSDTAGLVISPATAALTRRNANPETRARKHLKETFDEAARDEPTKLHLAYFYSGEMANSIRQYLANSSLAEISRDYLDLHKRSFPALTLETEPTWTDDEEKNTIHLELRCLVPDLWKNEQNVYTAELYPWLLRDLVLQPDKLTRTAPLALWHPYDVVVDTTIRLGDDWKIADDANAVETAWFGFKQSSQLRAGTLTLHYAWSSRTDHVPASELPSYVAKLAEMRKHVGYTLTYNQGLTEKLQTKTVNWRTTTLVVLLCAGWIGFGIWLWRRPRPAEAPTVNAPPPLQERLEGIGGWLLLPALGLCLRPFILLHGLFEGGESYFSERTWLVYSLPESASYEPNLLFVVVVELLVNFGLLGLSLLAAVFFFARRREAPLLLIALLAAVPLALGGYQLLIASLPLSVDLKSADDIQSLVQGAVAAAVWIPYFRTSRRVRATFTR